MPEIRDATPDEAERLTALALRSKAHWGYSNEFIEACRDELTMTPTRVGMERVRVAFVAGEVVGLSSLVIDGAMADLSDLFVEPDHIGSGVGRALWDDLVAAARELGAETLRIEADPHATAWYVDRGAVVVGEVASGSIPGRFLPLLELSLARALAQP